MSFIQINSKVVQPKSFALFNLGFRPFFLGASVIAVASMSLWMAVYSFQFALPISGITSLQWHSHEMIYGYGLAVVTGFLLTAITNWTGVMTVSGSKLMALFGLWLTARVLFLFGTSFINYTAFFDLLFVAGLFFAVAKPIIAVKQWKQMGILAKVMLLALGNLSFYLGAFGFVERGAYWGIYGGLYLIIGLLLTIGGRVMPAFITNGVDYEVKITNPAWIMKLNLVLLPIFLVSELFLDSQKLSTVTALGLFAINTLRLYHWHTPGIWRKPLLWSLYTSFLFVDLGFLLFAMSSYFAISKFIAIHALAFGGIGLSTISMMARVSLGHTGRSPKNPNTITSYAMRILFLGAVMRVILPLAVPGEYLNWILLSQVLWIVAFTLIIIVYAPMLLEPRIDGQPG